MDEQMQSMLQQHVYCTQCTYFRIDDEERPYCYHSNECDIGNCEDSMALSERPCYVPIHDRWRMLKPCLVARLCAVNKLAVAGHHDDLGEMDFALRVQRISDIEVLW